MSDEWLAMTWRPVGKAFEGDPRVPYVARLRSPFYEGDRFAVRNDLQRCLNVDGEWEYEPVPSERDDAFYKRCRFMTLETAQRMVEEVMGG